MQLYDNIKRVCFSSGSSAEMETLMHMELDSDICYVILTNDTDKLHCVVNGEMTEITGIARHLIQYGMFPNLSGTITPDFKLLRADIGAIFASVNDPAAPNLGIKR